MIDFLDGCLAEKSPTRVVLELGGVGYEVFVSLTSYARLPDVGARCRVWVHDYVREDQHLLYGFATQAERRMFGLLLGVTGIGPRTAMSALSGLAATELATAIANGDTARLSSISGIGRKTADRLVVELREKISQPGLPGDVAALTDDRRVQDAARALVALGYKTAEAQKMAAAAAARLPPEGTVEDIIRQSLRR
jgi:Holliday junction DNA helicase RuvA